MKRRPRETRPDASDGATVEVAAEEQARPGQLGLQVSAPPADLVTSARLKGVRFDLAQPHGYFTEQVDTLVKLLTSSLAWHEEALCQRDQGIHLLQTDLGVAVQELAADRERSAETTAHVASLESQVASLESQLTSLGSQVALLGSGALKQPV